ncbi:peptide-binding protein [Niabella insulamsoli]|uniref:peptide-binding protein n=1 Tax=Niabella insulamsoli TaxID=3144874 RepID=UPI0031FD78EB
MRPININRNFFLLIFLITCCNNLQAQHHLFVSLKGTNQGRGTKADPFVSIERATDYAKTLRGAVVINIDAGLYYLNNTIHLNAADFQPKSLVIKNTSAGEVTISGGKRLKLNWEPFKNGIYMARVDEGLTFERMFCNDVLQVLARYPNFDTTARVFNGTAADAIDPERVQKWKDPRGGYVHALHAGEWGGFHYRITGVDEKGALKLEGGWQNNRPSPMHKKMRFVENIFEELDAPGEWFHDKKEHVLYFYPPANTDITNAKIEVSQLKESFILSGEADNPLTNIVFSGLRFTHNERSFMETKEPLLRSDWTFYRGGALLFDGTEQCEVSDCTFEGLGGNAIVFSNYNKTNKVQGCHIYNIGANAISFIGDMNAVRSPSFGYPNYVPYPALDKTPGPKNNNYPQRCLVDNNLLHDLGQIEKQATGVQIEVSAAITVSRNSIYNVPRAGINIGDGCFGGHVISYNDVFNTVLETGDHGSFNSWGRDRFWAPRRKYMDSLVALHPELILLDAQETTVIHDNRWRCDHGWDVDLDDGSSNYFIYNNLFLNGGLKFREGFYRKAENNIMVNNTFHPHVWFKNSGDVFRHNIVMQPYAPIGVADWGNAIDQNLFLTETALLAARKNGTDSNSVFGDPLFVDPTKGNFNVAANSPALKIGFKNFRMDSFGVQKPALKKIAQHPQLPELLISSEKAAADQTVSFLGGWIKSVNGLGDRSAFGLPDETGVIVVQTGNKLLAASSLQPNDVIRTANGTAVKNIESLFTIYNKLKNFSSTLELVVIRGQQTLNIKLNIK